MKPLSKFARNIHINDTYYQHTPKKTQFISSTNPQSGPIDLDDGRETGCHLEGLDLESIISPLLQRAFPLLLTHLGRFTL